MSRAGVALSLFACFMEVAACGSSGPEPEPACTAPEPAPSCVAQIAMGSRHRCAIRTDRTLLCWGDNHNGQLGDGSYDARDTPTPIFALTTGVESVSVGGDETRGHTCVVTTEHTLFCFGSNAQGQLGTGDPDGSASPLQLAILGNDVAAVSAGAAHTCAIKGADRTLWCWGQNTDGACGVPITTDTRSPVAVTSVGPGVLAVAAGAGFTCAVKSDHTAVCFGRSPSLQPGTGVAETASPLLIFADAIDVAAATPGAVDENACALKADGTVACWGRGDYGQLGNGDVTNSLNAVFTTAFGAVTHVTLGSGHACALGEAEDVWCWGGRLNDHSLSTPRKKACLSRGVVAVSAGSTSDCAVRSDGTLWCWNSGDLASSPAPLPFPCP